MYGCLMFTDFVGSAILFWHSSVSACFNTGFDCNQWILRDVVSGSTSTRGELTTNGGCLDASGYPHLLHCKTITKKEKT